MTSLIPPRHWLGLALLALAFGSSTLVRAQGFDDGSDGSYGAIAITADTKLTTPADGIFKCTTLTVDAGKTLTFTRNALNTPIQILATGDVTIAGTIDVSGGLPGDGNGATTGGAGGPGGYDGGPSGWINSSVQMPAGDGQGPGGGLTASASNLLRTGQYAGTYGGKLLLPLVGGSGGAGYSQSGNWGGGGGGAILIASNTKITVTGAVRANGSWTYSNAGAGSGGAIRLVSPKVYGNGTIEASDPYSWAFGYIRIDSMYKVDPADNTQKLNFSFRGNTSIGGNFVLSVSRSVQITAVAGQNMSTTAPNSVLFPIGTVATGQTAAVYVNQLSGAGNIKVSFAIIPASGPKTVTTKTVAYDFGTGNTGNQVVSFTGLTFPTNVVCQVQAWADDVN